MLQLFVFDASELSPLSLLLLGTGEPSGGLLRIPSTTCSSPATLAAARQASASLRADLSRVGEGSVAREELEEALARAEADEASALVATSSPTASSPAEAMLVELLSAYGGAYPMARLSGFLKRAAPEVGCASCPVACAALEALGQRGSPVPMACSSALCALTRSPMRHRS
ncbi:MAG: hypothetical protein SGPRY_013613, partial [Prymnesium sp.]